MYQKCYQCKITFFENPVQYNKRSKIIRATIVLAPPICKDCNRIKLAKERENERKFQNSIYSDETCIQNPEKSHDEELFGKAVQLKKKLGFLGILNIVMHFKVSHEKAREIHDKIKNMPNM